MQMSSLQIDAGQIGFGQVDSGEVGPRTGFCARFHPLFVLVQNFSEVDERNSDSAFSGGRLLNSRRFFHCRVIDRDFRFQFFHFFDCLDFRSHANTFPR